MKVVYVLKPNIERLSKDYSYLEIARLFREVEGCELKVSVDEPDDFYKRIYMIEVDADTDSTLELVRTLEEALHS